MALSLVFGVALGVSPLQPEPLDSDALRPRMLLAMPCGGSSFMIGAMRTLMVIRACPCYSPAHHILTLTPACPQVMHGFVLEGDNKLEPLWPGKNTFYDAKRGGMPSAVDAMVADAVAKRQTLSFKAFSNNIVDCGVVTRLAAHGTHIAAAMRSNLLDYLACQVRDGFLNDHMHLTCSGFDYEDDVSSADFPRFNGNLFGRQGELISPYPRLSCSQSAANLID